MEKGKATTPVFWPGEFHGLCSPWVRKSRTRLSDFDFDFDLLWQVLWSSGHLLVFKESTI